MNAGTKIIAAAALALVGCSVEVKPDHASGKDFEKAGAQELFLDKLIDDYISAEEGDNTDWKYFKVKDKGILELTVYWDNKEVRSDIEVRDRFGVILDRRSHSAELEKDRMEMRVEPGTHFVRLYTGKGASVYTIEAKFTRFDHSPNDDVVPVASPLDGGGLLEEPIPMAAADPGPTGRRPAPRGEPRPQAAPPLPRRAAAPAGIQGTITRLIPGGGNRSTILTISLGANDGVKNGDKGVVLDDNGGPLSKGGLLIEKVSAKSATARTNLTAGEIGHRRRVLVFAQ